MFGDDPLIGIQLPNRFINMKDIYNSEMSDLIVKIAKSKDINI